MKQIFFLAADHLDLAREEVICLTGTLDWHSYGRILIARHTIKDIHKRIAYTHSIYDFLFRCDKGDLPGKLKSFNWQKYYKKDFAVRIAGIGNTPHQLPSEEELAGIIWHGLKKPKVNLGSPTTEITFFIYGDLAFCGLLKHKISKEYEDRRPHLRPVLHPTSLHPKLAKACINLTGITSRTAKIADLLCGSGGIMMEMGLMGFKPIGIDNDKRVIWKAKVNLDYYGIDNYRLLMMDVFDFNEKIDYAVSDLPYGRNTKKAGAAELAKFYLAFMKHLRKILRRKAVIIFPSFASYRSIISRSGFKLEREFTVYIHSSLSRKICLIS